MVRVIISAVISFVATLIIGRALIPALIRLKSGQSIKTDGPVWHMSKQGTPTMGGIMFIVGLAIALVVSTIPEVRNGEYGHLCVYLFALVFGVIGFIDDYFKVKKKQNEGLTAKQKFVLQLIAAVIFTFVLRKLGYLTQDLYIPFANVTFYIPLPIYVVFAAFVMVGTVNAVNITDGVDGLSSSVTLPTMLFFTVVGVIWSQAALSEFAAALFGGLCAFLVYNHYPAKVFMGDTGSLFLGGAVCGLAFAYDMPIILILVGIIYIAETLSDIIQVGYFKMTHGKRIFRMAPLHHHFEMGGWSEKKVVGVFAAVQAIACVVAFLGVMHR